MIIISEYAYNPIQLVEPNQNVILNDVIPCPKGNVLHREQSGILILRGITNNCFARYQVTMNANIALPEDAAAVVPISVALAIDGEPVQTSRAIFTPAAVDEYGNVTSTKIVKIPWGSCPSLSVEYVNGSVNDPTFVPTPVISVVSGNLRIAPVNE